MRLKRVYHQDKLVRSEDSGRVTEVKRGAVAGVRVMRASPGIHRFSPKFLEGALREGWLRWQDGNIVISQVDGEDLLYRVLRDPGIYCCYTDKMLALPGAGRVEEFLKYVEEVSKGKPSPDPMNPAGYRQDNFYACVLEEGEQNADLDELAAVERKIREGFWTKVGKKHGPRPARIGGGADLVFNIAKGRAAELYNRVDTNDPANSALIIAVIDANGDADDTMRDRDTLGALLGGTANEVTNTNYARKTLTDSDLTAFAPDDTNNRVDLDIADQTWTAIAAGTAWTDFLVNYDNDTTGGDDTNVVPVTLHDFAVTPDGSDITAQIASAGFFRAS